ncbi:luc7-like protein 3 isoform X2 [Oscarella lobularis]|uniref:luc7-like protein 3 isoform X2 n=1 Tax=Oscarella lobularis TaxID=121494 RepID=UPI00331398F9
MTSIASKLLDELMGKNRNLGSSERDKIDLEISWSDSKVCKHFLCGFCPNEMFTNTKADLGPCGKMHDEKLKERYEQSEKKGKMGYEEDFLRYLESLVNDLDRKVKRGRERLKQSEEYRDSAPQAKFGPEMTARLDELSRMISESVEQMETLGNEGNVDEAREVMLKVEDLKREREYLINQNRPKMDVMMEDDIEKRMEVCDVCGSFLVVNDLQIRVDAHVMGKQHRGYATLRQKLRELRTEKDKIREERRRQWEREREEKRHRRSRSRERRHRSYRSRSRSRSRSHSREREYSGSHRRHSSHHSRRDSRDR